MSIQFKNKGLTIRFIFLKVVLACILFNPSSYGQEQTTVKGRVIDATSDDPIPYAEVYFKNQPSIGTTTDFEGFFKLQSGKKPPDSIEVSQLGYVDKAKVVEAGKKQTINFQLKSTSYQMETVKVEAGKYPSTILLENVWKNKEANNKNSLKAYEYESYSRTEVSINNMSEDFKKRDVIKPLKPILDTMQIAAGEDGERVLPVFVSETLSKVYEITNPKRQKEVIKASKVNGVGLEDGGFVSQFVGASFQQYNFYERWLTIVDKNFVSPIGKSGLNFYDYKLVDTQVLNGFHCFKVNYKPKREKDLAFTGSFWIHDTTYALKRITAETDEQNNVNFIDKFKIHQELLPTKKGPWLPSKTRVTVDVNELTDKTFGVLGKYFSSNKDFVINNPKDLKFYQDDIEKVNDYQQQVSDFWEENRHGRLSGIEKKAFSTVDSIRDAPIVKSYVDVVKTIADGYLDVGKVDVGSYLFLYGNNVVEGHRFRIGAKTNEKFSKNWLFKGHLAYGTQDKIFKYNLQAENILSRESWTKAGFQHKYDLKALGVNNDFFQQNTLFKISTQLGFLDRFNQLRINRLWLQTDLFKGFTQRAYVMTKAFQPKGNYVFAYQDPADGEGKSNNFQTTEISLQSRYAPKEKTIINGNDRVRLNSGRAPIFTLRYKMGLSDILGGDFDYQKVSLDIEQDLNMGPMGRGHYNVSGTKIFNKLPYPLLNILPGNETIFRSDVTYNMMNFYEFVADRTVEVSYTQHFEGFLLNRIPLVKKLNLRLVGGAKAALGDYAPGNNRYLPDENLDGEKVTKNFKNFKGNKPYIEVSYGLENILKFIRIDAIHRLTYLRNADIDRFGVKGSFYFSF